MVYFSSGIINRYLLLNLYIQKNKHLSPFIYIQLHLIKLLPSSKLTFLTYIFSFPFKVFQFIV